MSDIPLNVSATAVFVDDGKGGTVARTTVSPQTFGSVWEIKRVVVTTDSSGANGSSQFRMYRGSETPSTLVDGTYSGDQDVNETDVTLMTLENLVCVWTGGDLDAHATVIISGTNNTGR